MSKEIRKDLNSIPIIPEEEINEKSIWKYEDLIKEKPRASVREIKQAYKVMKIFKSLAKERKELKNYFLGKE